MQVLLASSLPQGAFLGLDRVPLSSLQEHRAGFPPLKVSPCGSFSRLVYQIILPSLTKSTQLHARHVHCCAPHERLQQFASEFALAAHLRLLGATSISTVVARYLVVPAWLQRGKKQEKEGEPQTMLPSNGEAVARLPKMSTAKEPRDDTTDEENHVRRRLLHRVICSSVLLDTPVLYRAKLNMLIRYEIANLDIKDRNFMSYRHTELCSK
ncbi:hypothetical protein B296_00050038 [Ensete ventricosum]|uniref:Uncharacterized protein n=1 Tax=Ensete ventricosum TaxID=4639 RepID=A0A426X170_ENSVE|nr:hypothetical protein B296_00050038 [Ensete ventricosum]